MRKLLIIGAALVAAPASQGSAENLPQLDSTQFSHRYEMETRLTAEDVDGDGNMDFLFRGTDSNPSYGVLSKSFGNGNYYSSENDSGDGCAWRRFVSSLDGDCYTIELRAKVNSMTDSFAFSLAASDGSGYDMCLLFKTNGVCWGHPSSSASITNFDATASFHTYRVAKIPGESRSALWCDGVLVNGDLGDAFSHSDLNRLYLGSISSSIVGSADISYLRFTKGAYAPLKKRDLMRDSADFEHKYEMDSNYARFSPTESTSDWSVYAATGSATLSDGVLSVSQEKGKVRYYTTTGPMDPSITASSPFTLEVKVKINSVWDGASYTMNIFGGTPRTSYSFLVGPDCVIWGAGNQRLHSGDNTDGMHVFRISYVGDGNDAFTLWRDGEMIGEGLHAYAMTEEYNYVRFGILSGTHGGDFELDYIRWTTDGAFLPYVPPPGIVIMVL